MKYLVLFIVIIMSACSTQSTKSDESETATQSDTIEIINSTKTTKSSVRQNENQIYVNIANYFSNTGEFYVSIDCKSGLELKLEQLTPSLDSMIYEDEEYTRRRLPMSIAEKWFELSLLDSIKIFNEKGEYITDASLTRVEYYEDMLFSQFVAVLKPVSNVTESSDVHIALNPGPREVEKSQEFEKFESISFTRSLPSKISESPQYLRSSSHVEDKSTDIVYSSLTFTSEDFDHTSYLIESSIDSAIIQLKLSEDYVLDDIHVTPLKLNDKPVFILQIGVPDTDNLGHSPAFFDGKKYVLTNKTIFEIP